MELSQTELNLLDFAHSFLETTMNRTFVPLRRLAALSTALALFWVPIASAQSPETAPSRAAVSQKALLSPTAFARLVQSTRTDAAGPLIVKDVPRIDLRRALTVPATRRATALFASAPQQRSWAARHKVLTGVLVGLSAFFGFIVVCLLACEE